MVIVIVCPIQNKELRIFVASVFFIVAKGRIGRSAALHCSTIPHHTTPNTKPIMMSRCCFCWTHCRCCSSCGSRAGRYHVPPSTSYTHPTPSHRATAWLPTILLAALAVLGAIGIGSAVEERRASQAPDTAFLYTTPRVCAATVETESLLMETYESVDQVTALSSDNDAFVAHCGDCGKCSNPHDIAIYDETRNTLFETAVRCAKKSFLVGRTVADRCMDDNVGFTDGCRDCWVENIMCDVRYCVFACLLHTVGMVA